MRTGYRGTFVIPWAHTEVDGVAGADLHTLAAGSTWRWTGEALRVDGPSDLLLLKGAQGEANLRKRAARSVKRLVGAAFQDEPSKGDDPDDATVDRGFIVTDGASSFTVTEIATTPGHPPLLMFYNEVPPADRDLWVVHSLSGGVPLDADVSQPPGVICFAKGTKIRTPDGPCLVEDLREGDRIETKDNGAQEILWIGNRRMSGARLYAMPRLRPVRIRAGALNGFGLGMDVPDEDLLVSPHHRILLRGRAAEALFQTPEVLVRAEDLINDRTIMVDHSAREVSYVHLMLEKHQIVWANGVETESFHPANTSLDLVLPEQRARLLDYYPSLAKDPHAYGGFARRNLKLSEAAILQHEGRWRH